MELGSYGYLPPAWLEALRRERRSKPLYKPALLLVVLDLIEEGLTDPGHVRFDDHLERRFDALLENAGETAGVGKAWQPFFHLSTVVGRRAPIWSLTKGDVLVAPSGVGSRGGLRKVADGARLRSDLAAPLRTPGGRFAVREEIYRWATSGAGAEQGMRLVAAHNPRWPAIERAAEGLRESLAGPFRLFREHPEVVLSEEVRYARDWALRFEVLPLYDHRCSLCGVRIRYHGRVEATAAHIVPVHVGGSDDVRNALSLCRTHHWAFDEGLWGVAADRRAVVVDAEDGEQVDLEALRALEGRTLVLPEEAGLRPHDDALAWHRAEVFAGAA